MSEFTVKKNSVVSVSLVLLLGIVVAVWGASSKVSNVLRDVKELKTEQEKHPMYEQEHNSLHMGMQHVMTLQEMSLRKQGIQPPARPVRVLRRGHGQKRRD